ncbi:MAG: hypothetical protein AAFY65_09060 [Pseudomonadota bacterium]
MHSAKGIGAMGVTKGAMLPAILHGPRSDAGRAFVLRHVVVLVLAVGLSMGVRSVRATPKSHLARVPALLGGAALTAMLVCLHCLFNGHTVPDWIG